MTRHVAHTRNPNKNLKLRVQFSVTLSPDERTLLLGFAASAGLVFAGDDERATLRRVLEQHGLDVIEEAALEAVYELPQDVAGESADYEEGGAE